MSNVFTKQASQVARNYLFNRRTIESVRNFNMRQGETNTTSDRTKVDLSDAFEFLFLPVISGVILGKGALDTINAIEDTEKKEPNFQRMLEQQDIHTKETKDITRVPQL